MLPHAVFYNLQFLPVALKKTTHLRKTNGGKHPIKVSTTAHESREYQYLFIYKICICGNYKHYEQLGVA